MSTNVNSLGGGGGGSTSMLHHSIQSSSSSTTTTSSASNISYAQQGMNGISNHSGSSLSSPLNQYNQQNGLARLVGPNTRLNNIMDKKENVCSKMG